MKPKAVLFDFDYTLGDSTPGIYDSACYALNKMGHPTPTLEQVRVTIGMSLPKSYAYLTGDPDPEKGEAYMWTFREKAENDGFMMDSTTLYPHSADLLHRLHEMGIKLGIVSTKRRVTLVEIFTKFNLMDVLSILVGHGDVPEPKPHPGALQLALHELGVSPQDAVYVGDNIVDAMAAQAANIPFIGMTTGTTSKAALSAYPHTHILSDLSNFPY